MLTVSSVAHAQISDDAVKIGVLTDHSGGFAYLVGKHSVEAAQMAVDDFGGKVLGKPITVVTADHQNKPDIAATLSRKWFDTEGVDAITDVAGSAVALATQEIARSRNKILLISGAATTELTGKACSATTTQWSYDRHLRLRQGNREPGHQAGRQFVVLPDERLCLRSFASERCEPLCRRERRQGHRECSLPVRIAGFLIISSAGSGFQGQGYRLGHVRGRPAQCDQAGA
jgi:branched-chain amino acid transport system substrate-binding protein